MFWVLGSTAVSAAVLGFCLVLIGARNPKASFWFKDLLVANLWVPAIICSGIVGIGCWVKALTLLPSEPPAVWVIGVSAAVVAGTVAGVKLLQVRKRLAAFEARQAIRDTIENARKKRKAAVVEDGAPVDPNRPKRAA